MSTFGKKKLIRDISANTVQTGITQVFGLIIFYITSKYLQKNDFGELNWCMAVGATLIAIASLGLDLVFVKRVAMGENVLVISGIHFFHTVITGLLLCSAAFAVKQFVPAFTNLHPFFFFVFINLALANVANSFKLCLNGLEAYRLLAILALCSNVVKLGLILMLYLTGHFSILNVVFAYTLTSLLELLIGYAMLGRQLSATVKPLIKVVDYKYFILESLPQLGIVLFDSALARIDWILLGIIGTAAATAEYSFTYRIFELSKLPLLIIAPVLLTRFSKLFGPNGSISATHKEEMAFYFRLEMYVLMLIPIVLICTWTPLIDFFTNGKYGAVNETNYHILAVCVPLHGLINFLWTMGFVQGQLKTILFITIAVSVLNIVANAVFIPAYGATGSAIAFLTCTLIQLLLYLKFINQSQIRLNRSTAIISFINALAAILLARYFIHSVIFAAIVAVLLHTCFSVITKQLRIGELKQKLFNSTK